MTSKEQKTSRLLCPPVAMESQEGVDVCCYEPGLYLQGYISVSGGEGGGERPCVYKVCVCVCVCVNVCASWSASLASGGKWPAALQQEST